MAASGAWATEGGNYQIFEQFAHRSGADIKLGSTVVSIHNTTEVDENGHYIKNYVVTTEDGADGVYDAVLLASPMVRAAIENVTCGGALIEVKSILQESICLSQMPIKLPENTILYMSRSLLV